MGASRSSALACNKLVKSSLRVDARRHEGHLPFNVHCVVAAMDPISLNTSAIHKFALLPLKVCKVGVSIIAFPDAPPPSRRVSLQQLCRAPLSSTVQLIKMSRFHKTNASHVLTVIYNRPYSSLAPLVPLRSRRARCKSEPQHPHLSVHSHHMLLHSLRAI